MSNYTKSTNFATKDALTSGDPNKVVKGTEIDNEFNAIAGAIASKADTASPALTGTPTAPTAVFGTNTTQLATTAFATAALQAVYPIGSIYINASSTSNPSSLMGFGTWVEFGAGRVLVGLNASDALFDALEETGGSKDAIVVSHTHTVTSTGTTASSLGSHSHTFSGTSSGQSATHNHGASSSVSDPGHLHGLVAWGAQGGQNTSGGNPAYGTVPGSTTNTATTGVSVSTSIGYASNDHTHTYSGTTSSQDLAHTHTVSVSGTTASTGSSGTNANLQPYIVVKMWKRTA